MRTFLWRGGGAVRAPMFPDARTVKRAEADLVAADAAPTPEDPTEPSSTLVLDRGGPRRAWAVKQLEAGCEAKFPSIDWVRNDVPFDQALKQATVATLAGNAADNLHPIASWVPTRQEIGGLEPLDDYFTEEEWSQIPTPLLDSMTFGGEIMAMPWVPAPIRASCRGP